MTGVKPNNMTMVYKKYSYDRRNVLLSVQLIFEIFVCDMILKVK